MNFNSIMQQAQKMQRELAKKLDEFEQKEFEYDYQNSSVVVKLNGKLEILNITISDVLVDPEDKTTLQEMVCEAVNSAIKEVSKAKDAITSSTMPKGGMPGLF
ncbi:MAG: YbaB/EbfC family nucleoid-associated protein [Mycoplasmoidaceae bacterium]|nr:YbaB/EbfC family nucleoid-associated protein [Mycoplasmoidaceae bacterium]